MTTVEPTLTIDRVGRRFGGRWALRDCSVSRQEPGVVAVLGANGSGKTTLLRIVAQLLEPSEGSVLVCGAATDGDGATAARRAVGYVPHRPLAYDELTVEENLVFAARVAGLARPRARAAATAVLDQMRLRDSANEPVGVLSRGWQQRYSLARAELLSPPVLLLDEPTTGLDASGRAAVEAALDRWSSDRIVLLATHERSWVGSRSSATLELEP